MKVIFFNPMRELKNKSKEICPKEEQKDKEKPHKQMRDRKREVIQKIQVVQNLIGFSVGKSQQKEIIKEHFSELKYVSCQIEKSLTMSSKINEDPHHMLKNSTQWSDREDHV